MKSSELIEFVLIITLLAVVSVIATAILGGVDDPSGYHCDLEAHRAWFTEKVKTGDIFIPVYSYGPNGTITGTIMIYVPTYRYVTHDLTEKDYAIHCLD